MSRSARSLARGFAALTAAAVLTSVFAGPAGADEPTPTATATSAAPSTAEAPATSGAPASSEAPAASSPQPENKPAAAQPQDEPAPRARIDASIAFDRDKDHPYRTDEDIRFTVKMTNSSDVTAEGVNIYQLTDKPTDLNVPYGGWGDLNQGHGITLEPGHSFEVSVTGKVRDVRQTTVDVRAVLFDKTGFSVSREFGGSAGVVSTPVEAAGVVYGDKNGNGARDGDEALAGIKLTLRYVHGDVTYTATSGHDGTLTFNVPAADYYIGGDVVDGWLFPWRTVHIGQGTKLDLRGAPPLNGALKASMKFTQGSYQVGDTVHLTVTLSNSGKTPLTGIVAECNRIGDSYILQGTGPGWGDLVSSRGVTIGAGETRTFDVTDTVPAAALNRGYVVASCDFGYVEVDIENHAEASDQATVPGGSGAVIGDVQVVSDQGQAIRGVPGVKVVLTAEQACPVIGEQTTDEKGHFEFHKLVPGLAYKLYFLPPKGWKIKDDNPTSVDVYGPESNAGGMWIPAEEGDAPLPSVPVDPADCTAGVPTSTTGAAGPGGGTGGGQSGASGLASTGVDAVGLGALALLALALGGGLVFGARRRRRTI